MKTASRYAIFKFFKTINKETILKGAGLEGRERMNTPRRDSNKDGNGFPSEEEL